MPRPGDVVLVDKRASVQFAAVPRFFFRVIRHRTFGSTPDGWAWIDGYQLNDNGDAIDHREIFVEVAGLRAVAKRPDPRTRNTHRPAARPGSGVIPRQRAHTTSTTTTSGRTR